MLMRLGFAIFILVCTAYVSIPAAATPTTDGLDFGTMALNTVTTVVRTDSGGAIHIIWAVPPAGAPQPGIWYSKYDENGTRVTSPRLIWNSSTVQSADMVIDRLGVPHIVWTDGLSLDTTTLPGSAKSLYMEVGYAEVNSTDLSKSLVMRISRPNKFVVWPSIAVDDNLTSHMIWSQVELNGTRAGAYYASVTRDSKLESARLIASYHESMITLPRPRVAFDGSNGLHIVWVESGSMPDGRVLYNVTYARLDLKTSNVTRRPIASLVEKVDDLTITAVSSGSAYIVWRAIDRNDQRQIYISRISRTDNVLFLKEVEDPSPQSNGQSLLSLSVDSDENLYAVWYQPSFPLPRASQSNATSPDVTYLKMRSDGTVSQLESQTFDGSVIAVGVTQSGDLYAISSQGVIRAKGPQSVGYGVLLAGVITVAALGGAAATQEGKYRITRSVAAVPAKFGRPREQASLQLDSELLRLISRRPGIGFQDFKRVLAGEKPSMLKLALMERAGYVSSIRVGLTRRFYCRARLDSVDNPNVNIVSSIATSILHEIERNPGIWEGQLSHSLGLSQQIVHYHLRKIQATGMLSMELKGRRKLYRLTHIPKDASSSS